MSTTPIPNQLALDPSNLAAVKRQARDDPRAALRVASQQFEAVFLNMVLKSMRDATPQTGLLDGGGQTRMYQQMLDQQLAQTLSSRGSTGLAAAMEKQLARALPRAAAGTEGDGPDGLSLPGLKNSGSPVSGIPVFPSFNAPSKAASGAGGSPAGVGAANATDSTANVTKPDTRGLGSRAREFIDKLWPHALEAARATGIPAHFMIAQAALETGWGKSEIRTADGKASYNLFGLKAGRNWRGDAASASTTEYSGGVAQKSVERFRTYSSYAEAFRDYAKTLLSNPRYAGVVGQQDPSAFAKGLQRAGYATDPMYAAKLERIIGGPTLRQALAGDSKVYG